MEGLLDPRSADTRVEFGMARAEVAMRSASAAYAEQLAAIDATLREAREFPEVFVGTALGGYGTDAVEFAERAAIADLAMRLCLAEQTVRGQAHEAEMLRQRSPRLWELFRDGEIPAPNARAVADLVGTLSEAAWQPFEDAVLEPAATLAPARFRSRARVIHERLQPDSLDRRHRRRVEERRVFVEPDSDGMCWLTAYLPAADAQRALRHVDHLAGSLHDQPGETRTLAQLRADVARDLLAGILGSTGAGVTVAVTVPVLTLLGGDEPGTLEGYGPIDADTARELAGHAPSFLRILTHPVTGAMLDLDRTRYRVPADLKRWVQLRDQLCSFPGCGRLATECDLDHTIAWVDGGTTSADNLALLCPSHHRLKHNSRWKMERTTKGLVWTSPTGAIRTADPPPF